MALGVVVVDSAVLVEVVAQVVTGYRVPIVPPDRHASPVVAVHVLADEHRPVAFVLEPGGDRRFPEAQHAEPLGAPPRPRVPHDLVVVGVLAAQDGRPRRAAQGIGHEGALEGSALGRQLSEVGVVRRVLLQELGIQVVGEDEDHVRTIRALDDTSWRTTAGGEQEPGRDQREYRRAYLPTWWPRRARRRASHEGTIVPSNGLSVVEGHNLGYGAFKAALKTSWSSGEETIDGSDDDCLSQNTARIVTTVHVCGRFLRSVFPVSFT